VRLEGLGQLKKIHLIGTRTHDLPACSIVPQPTTLPHALHHKGIGDFKFRSTMALEVIFYLEDNSISIEKR
jgi:hypothetical protein